ncbi:MAG: Hsp70 family protein [Pseudanabaenaceae cyanobacterium bins.68]|nr:Hsp70 family protein [Pseudanabaenaceae cyanobacterium bins.68]
MTLVAIDFGTSNTVVCILDPVTQAPKTLKFDQISRGFSAGAVTHYVVPSLLYVQARDQLILGEQVRSRRLGFGQPERLFQGFKRDLAANFRPPSRLLDDYSYDVEAIAELFLTEIFAQVRTQVQDISAVVFTVPVGAFELYLDWCRDLAARLNLPNPQIIDESTAAALGYAIAAIGSIVLVIDFGGGTLDLSLVRTSQKQHQVMRAAVLAKADIYVGGIDIDTWIVEDYLRQAQTTRQEVGEIGWLNLLEIAERLKIKLTDQPTASESWFDDQNFISHLVTLDRDRLAEILEQNQLLEQLRQALDETLAIAASAGVAKSQIQQVLMVGGSSQLVAIQQLLVSYFGKAKVKLDQPFTAVGFGALRLDQTVAIDDYLHHGYAIRLWEPYSRSYSYYPLFAKGLPYPSKRDEPLVLQVASDGQTEIRLDIGEIGEICEAEVSYNREGQMTSSQLQRHTKFRSLISPNQVQGVSSSQACLAYLNPPGQTGKDRIEIYFAVTSDRVLVATVKDLLTQKILLDQVAIAKLN